MNPSFCEPHFMIVRVGDPTKNFKNSVLDRIAPGSLCDPLWGYNSDKCAGFPTISHLRHSQLSGWTAEGNAYVLFLPHKKGSILGLAKVSIQEKRESTNMENGWLEPTATGHTDWNIEMIIEKYWDFTMMPFHPDLFSYERIIAVHEHKLPQSSLLFYNEVDPLYLYLLPHIKYIITYFTATYQRIV